MWNLLIKALLDYATKNPQRVEQLIDEAVKAAIEALRARHEAPQ